MAADAGLLGSMDANRGDSQNGWDTDQLQNNIDKILNYDDRTGSGRFPGGGINFDAKIRRNSTDPADLFYAHVGRNGCPCFCQLHDNTFKNRLLKLRKDRYASFDTGKGKDFEDGKLTLEDLRSYAVENGGA